MRMSRWGWLAQFFKGKMGPQPGRRKLRKPREKKSPAEATWWDVTVPWRWCPVRVQARTRSEARARAKAELKVERHGRLPVGTVLRQVA